LRDGCGGAGGGGGEGKWCVCVGTWAVALFLCFLLIMDSVMPLSLDNLIMSDAHDFVKIVNHSNSPCIGKFNSSDTDETPYAESSFNFSYIDETAFCSQYKHNGKFLVMSLNIQSLNSKFNDLRQLVSNLLYHNCAPDIICLQEIWQIPYTALLSIPNYFPLECLTLSYLLKKVD
jgi:hypothetical protein